MSCQDKYTNIVDTPVNAKEVDYEGVLSEHTGITENCVNQHEVNEDVYNLIDGIKEDLDTSDLGTLSIDYGSNPIRFKSVIDKYEEEIDGLKTKVAFLEAKNYCDLDISDCGIDFKDLTDDCNDPINTLGDALQAIINKITV